MKAYLALLYCFCVELHLDIHYAARGNGIDCLPYDSVVVLAVFLEEYKKEAFGRHGPQLVRPSRRFRAHKPKKMAQLKNVEAIIDNKLYLGNILAARSTRTLTERRITHILSVCNDAIPAEVPESGICHKRINIEDIEYADILIHLPAICQFIHQSLTSGGTVLVHSVRGVSRSAAAVVAYFMWARRLGATDATELVRRARDTIWINPGFAEQLVLFQVCQYNPHPGDGVYASWKIKVDRKLRAAGLR